MPEEEKPQHKVNKIKVYASAVLLFIFGNFVFETILTLLENQLQTFLYPIFPYTRLFLLIITILLANYYIRRKQSKPKQKLWWRILKVIILFIIAWLLFFGAWFALSEAELGRLRIERENNQVELSPVPEPTLIVPEFNQ
ncbi:MAG: hypothetical protein KIH63_001070 [Candidatus Saccharibacteria bacterium]|nr:hypothetical protein [Candidatus Saccharibacteria bacterium]